MEYFSYILLVLYTVVLLLFVYKSTFFKSKKISKREFAILLGIKIVFGFLYVFFNSTVFIGGDIFHYFKDGNIIYQELFHEPLNYFKLVFLPNNGTAPKELVDIIYNKLGFWRDTGAYMIVRFNAIVRLFSFGNIYIHTLVATFLSFIGGFLITKVFETQFRANKIVLLSIFLTPSILYWTAGPHKEFISTLALGLILYNFFKLIYRFNKFESILFFTLGVVLFFFTRHYILLALVPSLLSYSIHKIFHVRFKRAVFFVMIVFIAFLNYQKIPGYNKTGFEVIIEKRHQFEDLKHGNTSIVLDEIEPTFNSLMKNAPKAIFNTIAKPHFGELKNVFMIFSSLENLLIVLLILWAFVNFHKLTYKESYLVIFMLLYAFSLLLLIGWIVPNIGAILRYRSIALIILIPTLLFVISKNSRFPKFKIYKPNQ